MKNIGNNVNAKETEDLIKQVENYLIDVLEKPRPEYEGLPACPFVKKERINNNLMIDIFDNSKESFLDKMKLFVNSDYTDAVFAQVINEPLPTENSKAYQDFLNRLLKKEFSQYRVIITNPNDRFSVKDFNPRRLAPCFLIVVTNKTKLVKAHNQMMQSKYFTNFEDDYLKFLNVKKEQLNLK